MITLITILSGLLIMNAQILKEEIRIRLSNLNDWIGLWEHEVWVAFGHQSRIFTPYEKTIDPTSPIQD